jgi:hypothetical protein
MEKKHAKATNKMRKKYDIKNSKMMQFNEKINK